MSFEEINTEVNTKHKNLFQLSYQNKDCKSKKTQIPKREEGDFTIRTAIMEKSKPTPRRFSQ